MLGSLGLIKGMAWLVGSAAAVLEIAGCLPYCGCMVVWLVRPVSKAYLPDKVRCQQVVQQVHLHTEAHRKQVVVLHKVGSLTCNWRSWYNHLQGDFNSGHHKSKSSQHSTCLSCHAWCVLTSPLLHTLLKNSLTVSAIFCARQSFVLMSVSLATDLGQ